MLWGPLIVWWNLYLVKGVWSEETDVLAEEGSQAVLPCQSNLPSAAVTQVQVQWGRGRASNVWRQGRSGLEYHGMAWSTTDRRPRVRCPHPGFSKGDYSLYMTNVTAKDGGLYTCRVQGQVQKRVTLRVIKVSTSPSAPIEGTNVVLSCNVTPWPKGATIHWRLNGELIGRHDNQINDMEGTPNPAHNIAVNQRVLRIKATQSLAGNWTCVVATENSWGEAAKHLSVRGIIHPTSDLSKVYAGVGSAVTLPCVFSHGSVPSNPVWEKMSDRSNPPPSIQLPSSSSSPWDVSASLGATVPASQGTYECSGMMEGRRLSRTLQLVLSHVESNRGDPELLTCQLSDDSEVTQYEWVLVTQDMDGTQIVTSKQMGRVLRINGVPDPLGQWACRFYGKKGMLGNATYTTGKISGLIGHSDTPLYTNSPQFTVLALCLMVAMLVLILAQICKTHKMERKLVQYPALKAMVHAMANKNREPGKNQANDGILSI